MMRENPDLEALLVALVLSPATYSRNRFFELYKDPAVRRARRRASVVRSVIRHLSPGAGRGGDQGAIVSSTTLPSGRVELTYFVPALGLRRTTTLDPLEAALVRYVTARVKSGGAELSGAPDDPVDRHSIEAALRRLAPSALDPQPSADPDPTA